MKKSVFSFHLPNVLIWRLSVRFDGPAFHLVFRPGGTLACSVTVMSKLALATPLELVLSAEAVVANSLCETADRGKGDKDQQVITKRNKSGCKSVSF